MKSYLGIGILGAGLALLASPNAVFAKGNPVVSVEKVQNNSDSLKIEGLAKDLKKLKPIAVAEFKAKFKKEIAGYQLTEVQAFEDKETGSYATANYKKGKQSIYLMVTDGAGPGSEQVKANLLNYLGMKEFEQPTDKSKVKTFKGWQVFFDWSMYEGDDLTSIQYVENNRFAVVSSANKVPIAELESFLNNISL